MVKLTRTQAEALAEIASGRLSRCPLTKRVDALISKGLVRQACESGFELTDKGWEVIERADIGLCRKEGSRGGCMASSGGALSIFPLDRRIDLVRETAKRLREAHPVRADAYWLSLVTRLRKELAQLGARDVDGLIWRFHLAVDREIGRSSFVAQSGGDAA